MNQSNKPSNTAAEFPKHPRYGKTPHHPVGLLYTRLHHSRGLPFEDARHPRFVSTDGQPDKTT